MKHHLPRALLALAILSLIPLLLASCDRIFGGEETTVPTQTTAPTTTVAVTTAPPPPNTVPLTAKVGEGLIFEESLDGTYYSVIGIGSCQETCLTIPDTYRGLPVKAIAERAFRGRDRLLMVVIPDSVTEIGEGAFADCRGLLSVTVPSSVTEIGAHAFAGCYRLLEVRNLSALTLTAGSVNTPGLLGYFARAILTDAEAPSCISVTEDGYLFFADREEALLLGHRGAERKLTLPGHCNGSSYEIYTYAFYGRKDITSVSFPPEGITAIGDEAFRYCASLSSLTLSPSVTEIGRASFGFCTALYTVTIPESVTEIGDEAFLNCFKLVEVRNLSSLAVEAGSTAHGYLGAYALDVYRDTETPGRVQTDRDGYLFYEKNGTVYLLGYIGEDTALTPPQSYGGKGYALYPGAFYRHSNITSVRFAPGALCTEIGENAFYLCESLSEVTLPGAVDEIGLCAFYGCSSLAAVEIPDSTERIGIGAFQKCTSLTSVTVPSSVTVIEGGAFRDCTSLSSVYIEDLSAWCRITFVTAESNPLRYASRLYLTEAGEPELITAIVIPDSITAIKNYTFIGLAQLTEITIPSSVTAIGNWAFALCTSLTSVTVPDSVESIGERAFTYCTSLTSVTIGNGVKSIGDNAFSDCSSLASVTIGNSVKSIGSLAFSNCASLTSVTIPDSVERIGYCAFYDCTSLASVTFADTSTWYATNHRGDVQVNVTNTAANAAYLKDRYCECLWYKK